MAKNRDDFTEGTRRKIGQRAGWLCSFPGCRAFTEGATSDENGRMSVGTASHICAAAPGGPRYDEDMSPEERRSVTNAPMRCSQMAPQHRVWCYSRKRYPRRPICLDFCCLCGWRC